MGTFWDFCAPFYDMAEKTNGRAYGEMLKTVNALIPHGAAVLEAAAELRRVAKSMVILPMSFTKNLRGTAKLGITIYRIFGFAPRIEFTAGDYESFLPSIGFNDCEHIQISGKIPMAVAVWKKEKR